MRLALQTIICWCVLTTVLPLVKGATEDFNSSLKKRFRVWLQSRTRRDLRSGFETASEGHSDVPIGPQQRGDTDEDSKLQSSFDLNIRSRRSTVSSAKKPSCVLITCSVHDLINRLHQFNNKSKDERAPEDKIHSTGYGRRRRSPLDPHARLTLQTGRPRSRWSNGTSEGGHHTTPPTLA